MGKARRQDSTDFSGSPERPQQPPHHGFGSRWQEARGGRAGNRAAFHRRPAHRRPGANFSGPALGAAGGPQGAGGRPPSRARVDGEAGRARALGPAAARAGSPALGYLDSEGHSVQLRGRRDATLAGQTPGRSWGAAVPRHAGAAPGQAGRRAYPASPAGDPLPRGAGRAGQRGRRRSRGKRAPSPPWACT